MEPITLEEAMDKAEKHMVEARRALSLARAAALTQMAAESSMERKWPALANRAIARAEALLVDALEIVSC